MTQVHRLDQKDLAEYFQHQLHQELSSNSCEDTRWYLGNLLARFSHSDRLFSHNQGNLQIRPLALLYDDALQCPHERERCLLLRQLGDQALFMGALFPEHYARKGIQRDYFIGMGGSAYQYLAHHGRELKQVFADLAEKFAQLLELIARICQRHKRYSATEIMAIYQRWRSSGDPALASQLTSMGISLDGDLQQSH